MDKDSVAEGRGGPSFYVPALDGLRGVAILSVMVFHGAIPHLRGGFIGVDIFFVLSGFLITSLLLKEQASVGRINLKNFYVKRALRLLPALFLLLGVFLVISSFLLEGSLLRAKFIEALVIIFYAANWARAFDWHSPETMGHAWSLSSEEQFYILWPALLILSLKFTRSKLTLGSAIALLAALSWAARILLAASGASHARLDYALDTRADALLAGCLLAVLISGELSGRAKLFLEKWLGPAALLAAAALAGAALLFSPKSMYLYYWGYAAVAFLASVIILDIIISKRSLIRKLLSWRPLVGIGVISYGLYLWHVPVYALVSRTGLTGPGGFAAGTCLTFLAAYLSFVLLERPCLRLKKRYLS